MKKIVLIFILLMPLISQAQFKTVGKFIIGQLVNDTAQVTQPGDTVATGKVARFNFTNEAQNVSGWNDCVYADSGLFVPVVDAGTGFTMNVTDKSHWGQYYGANNRGTIPDDGGGFAFPSDVINSYWYDYILIGPAQTAFYPNLFITGLNTTYLYKIQFLSSWYGTSPTDTIQYTAAIFQDGPTDTLFYSYFKNDSIRVNDYRNTSKTITTTFISPQNDRLNIQFGFPANPYASWGVINGLIITEYKKQQ